MRIAFGGISMENSNFSTLPARLTDFTIWRGHELIESGRYPFLPEWPVEFVPLLFAGALPGGTLEAAAYQSLKGEFCDRLRAAGPVDGVYLDLHGALLVEGLEDAEADLASAVRQIVGPQALITASMDLHGNITPYYTTQIDLLTAYRTAPHRDTLETRRRACQLLVNALTSGLRPQIACVPIPVLLPGEMTRTDLEPGQSLWAALGEIDRIPGVIDASLFVGFAWVDERRAHAAAVVTGTDRQVIERAAKALAQRYWETRTHFHYGITAGSIDECITWALDAAEPCVFISDSGDNLTAGAPGDLPLFLARLLAQPVPSALLAGLPDAAAVAACQAAGLGAKVELSLGGKLDNVRGHPLPVTALVQQLVPAAGTAGAQVVVQSGAVTIVATERRHAFTSVADFNAVGLNPLDYKIVVVKLGYLFPDLLRVAPRALLALSPGASDLALERLPYRQIERPMFPLDKEFAWSA